MATFEETRRSGRRGFTMRHCGRVAMGNFLRESTGKAENEPIMANQVDHAPRWQCRLRYFAGGIDGTYGKKTNVRETPERSAALGESSRKFTWRYSSTQEDRKPSAAK